MDVDPMGARGHRLVETILDIGIDFSQHEWTASTARSG
jgi:hypothetical protein